MSKYLLVVLSFFIFIGCSEKSLNMPMFLKEEIKDSSLPKVVNINYLISTSSVAFEWTPSYSSKIDGYKIYKKKEGDEKFEKVATISNRYSSHYVDNKIDPTSFYIYKFYTYSNNGTISEASKSVKLKTNRRIEKVPVVKAIVGLPGQIKIIWRPHPNPEINGYIIQRSDDKKEFYDIKKLEGRLQSEYIDSSLGNSVVYSYRVIAISSNDVKSYPSMVVEGRTKALPPVLQNLKATKNLAGQIKLSFDSSDIKDKKYYVIYRSIFEKFLYMQVAKVRQSFYTDKDVQSSKPYFYKVTVVDKDNLESPSNKEVVMGQAK